MNINEKNADERPAEKPFNIEDFRLKTIFDAMLATQTEILNVRVKKPGPQQWGAMSPDPVMRAQVAVINLKDEDEIAGVIKSALKEIEEILKQREATQAATAESESDTEQTYCQDSVYPTRIYAARNIQRR